tara:strand:+ start:215 stop:415 length:201 start_codon:yes stop_codon:yes gene_type:complete
MKLLIEAFFVGLSLAVFTHMIKIADIVKTDNHFVFMFIVGFLIHLMFEILGLNKWYCKNGAACSRN